MWVAYFMILQPRADLRARCSKWFAEEHHSYRAAESRTVVGHVVPG
jgi:hypothetical protein